MDITGLLLLELCACLATYQMLGHLTGLLHCLPQSHTTRFGFGAAIVVDVITYGALAALAQFRGWLGTLFLAWAAIHYAYLVAFVCTPALYDRMHDITRRSIFADGKAVRIKGVMLTLDSASHIIGFGFVCSLLLKSGPNLDVMLFTVGGIAVGALAYKYTGWTEPMRPA